MAARAYATTATSVTDSKADVMRILGKYGITSIAFDGKSGGSSGMGGFAETRFLTKRFAVRLTVPIPPASNPPQEERRIWRVLYWSLKAKLESVAAGAETMERAFLPDIVSPETGETVWETLRPRIEAGQLVIDQQQFKALPAGGH